MPLPTGGVPVAQTDEGGLQLRVARSGFDKLAAHWSADVGGRFADGVCEPSGVVGMPSGGFVATGARWCTTNQPGSATIPDACGANTGCNTAISVNSVSLAATSATSLSATLDLSLTQLTLFSGQVVGIGFSCSTTTTGRALIAGTYEQAVDPATGENTLRLTSTSTTVINFGISGCAVVFDVPDLLSTHSARLFDALVMNAASPALDAAVAGLLPGAHLEGVIDATPLWDDQSATSAAIEARVVSGGGGAFGAGGLSLAGIAAVNSDADVATRLPPLASEPSACASLPPLDLSAAPFSLPTGSRGAFTESLASPFLGTPEVGHDVRIGLSPVALALLGQHLAASGALCLDTDATRHPNLTVGELRTLLPGLGEAYRGDEPLVLTGHPTARVQFDVVDDVDGVRLVATVPLALSLSVGGAAPRAIATFDAEVAFRAAIDSIQEPTQPAALLLALVDVDVTGVHLTNVNASAFATRDDAALAAPRLPSCSACFRRSPRV